MRIALAFEFPTIAGGEQSILAIVDALQDVDEVEFVAIVPEGGPLPEQLRARKVTIEHCQIRGSSEGKRDVRDIARDLGDCLERLQPDILHANSLSMSRVLTQVVDLRRSCVTGHVRDIMRLSKRAIADLNRLDGLIAVSDATRAFHIGQGMQVDRLTRVYNGIDPVRFERLRRSLRLHRELGLSEQVTLAATIGQLCVRKGHDVLAEAAVTLCRQFPHLHFLVCGARFSQKQESVEYERDFIQRFAEAGYAGRLHLLGVRSDIPQVLADVDLLVHPARQEPLGRVLLEAAAANVPIVATDVGGTREILDDEVSALLVTSNDPAGLANAIARCLSDPTKALERAARARATIAERFSLTRAAEQHVAFWRYALERHVTEGAS